MAWIGLIIGVILCWVCFTKDKDFFAFLFGFLTFASASEISEILAVDMFIIIAFFLMVRNDDCHCWGIILLSITLVLGFCSNVAGLTSEGVFTIGNPTIEETRYEILGGNDTTRVSGSVSGYLYCGGGSISGSIWEDSFYKIYYLGTNAEGENIAIPKNVKESETEIVLCPNDTESEYLIETVTTQQYMERKWGRNPEEQYFEDVSYKYKLYVRESTFNNKVVLDGK